MKYIAIEREYGSGGTEIARRLAGECGIPCYGSEILEAVAREKGVSVEQIQRSEESVTNSFLYTVFAIGQMHAGGDLLNEDGKLFVAEQAFIRRTAQNGPAIYLGHCACEALRDYPVIRVFIRCSDAGIRTRRIRQQYGIDDARIESTRRRFDAKRARYYYANTAQKWEDPHNYDVLLDSATLGTAGCVAALKGLLMQA